MANKLYYMFYVEFLIDLAENLYFYNFNYVYRKVKFILTATIITIIPVREVELKDYFWDNSCQPCFKMKNYISFL